MWRWWSKLSKSCNLYLYFFLLRINGYYLFTWIITFLLSILATPMQNVPSCSYLKVTFFGWLFVSYLPVLISILTSSSLGKCMLCSFNLILTGGTLTCWIWTSLKKTSWVDFRDRSCSLSYQDDSCLIILSSVLLITNNMEKVKWVNLLSLFMSLHLISHLLFPLEVCWAWSTIASLVNTLPLFTYPHSFFLVVFSEFIIILGWSLLKDKLAVDLLTVLSPCVRRWKLITMVVYQRPRQFCIEFSSRFISEEEERS